MIADVPSFVRYFDGVHGRTVRDVSSLPDEAERWMPPATSDQESWAVSQIVRHIAEARGFFAGAFLDRGWIWHAWPDGLERRDSWIPALDRSRDDLAEMLDGAAEPDLARRVPMLDQPDRSLAAWRVLMMMVEHEVHHRSQLCTYAGLNGWPVNQLFGRTNEWVVSQREAQRGTRETG